MSDRFTRGAPTTLRGITLAFAFPVAGGPPSVPDIHRYWVQHGETWTLVDVRSVCRSTGMTLPTELTHPYFAGAYRDWLEAVARRLALLARQPAPSPTLRATEPPAKPFWWLEL